MAPRASAGAVPIAASTCDGATLPEEQAEPELTATPARSSAIISVAASTPGTANETVLGSRGAVSAKTTASATTERIGDCQAIAHPNQPRGLRVQLGEARPRRRPESGNRRDGFGARARAALLAAAANERRAETDRGARRDQRACALEAAQLVGGQHERVGAQRADVALDPPGHLHRVAKDEAMSGMDQGRCFRDRLDDAGLVVCALQR